MTPYHEALISAYEDEIGGAAFFEALADTVLTEGARAKLRLLAQVERATAAVLLPLVDRYALPVQDPAVLAEEGHTEAKAWATPHWPDLARRFAAAFPAYIAAFEALEAAAPEPDRAALNALTRHEIALVAFAEAEAEGRTLVPCPLKAFLDRMAH